MTTARETGHLRGTQQEGGHNQPPRTPTDSKAGERAHMRGSNKGPVAPGGQRTDKHNEGTQQGGDTMPGIMDSTPTGNSRRRHLSRGPPMVWPTNKAGTITTGHTDSNKGPKQQHWGHHNNRRGEVRCSNKATQDLYRDAKKQQCKRENKDWNHQYHMGAT